MRDEAARAAYERDRAHRARMIKLNARLLAERAQGSAGDSQQPLGCFSLIYESRDGRLCLYEDAQGHVSAVDSARFA